MDEPLDELYLTWLYSQVGSVKSRSRSRTYWFLLRQLYKTEFVWLIANDDNRVEDGRDLRHEFVSELNVEPDDEWMSLGCSMLEMLVGLSRRLSFEAEGKPRDWFWHLIENLDLTHHTDAHCENSDLCEERIAEILNVVIWRTYNPNGHGGLFPLRRPEEDQTNVELWYQLCAYVLELNPY